VVVSGTPPNITVEFAPKFAPLREIVKLPAGTEDGYVLHNCTGGCVIVSETAPDLLGYAVLVALTDTTLFAGMTTGAVYNPLDETVPTALLPPGMPFTAQVTVFGLSGT
jgi:hypothetical protein